MHYRPRCLMSLMLLKAPVSIQQLGTTVAPEALLTKTLPDTDKLAARRWRKAQTRSDSRATEGGLRVTGDFTMGSSCRSSAASIRLLLALFTAAALLTSGEASGAQLTASWVDNSGGIATTRVERRPATDTVFAAIADVPPGVATYVDASVRQGTTYCYRAFAYDDDGVSPYTDEMCATSSNDGVTVTISKVGTGIGTVASSPAGISCGTVCAASYLSGTLVTLTVTPDPGAIFNGWSGGCTGTAPCTLAGNAPVAVTASFSILHHPLTVTKSGDGTVTSSPAAINCGSHCSEPFWTGEVVTLTATPSHKGSTFVGWSGGGCSGSRRTCVVSVKAATSVFATFKNGNGR
jgi:hypothetical protein